MPMQYQDKEVKPLKKQKDLRASHISAIEGDSILSSVSRVFEWCV